MATTNQQKKFAALAKQSATTTEFSDAWDFFKNNPSQAAARGVVKSAEEVLDQAKVTGVEMVKSTLVQHKMYIAQDYLQNPPEAPTTKGFSSNVVYENVTDKKTGKTVLAKVTKYSFGK